MKTQKDYAEMQKQYYETTADLMDKDGNHRRHDNNPDYRGILLKELEETPNRFKGTFALDFGCGQGRNVSNMIKYGIFERVDGVDISASNIEYAEKNLQKEAEDSTKWKFFVNNGIDLNSLESDKYSFVMSTIVLQHICVHEIRYNLMKEIYRVMKPGGLFSFQMGYGWTYFKTAGYYENVYDATETNSKYDVRVEVADDIHDDLKKIGFSSSTHKLSKPYEDGHPYWIFVKAIK